MKVKKVEWQLLHFVSKFVKVVQVCFQVHSSQLSHHCFGQASIPDFKTTPKCAHLKIIKHQTKILISLNCNKVQKQRQYNLKQWEIMPIQNL